MPELRVHADDTFPKLPADPHLVYLSLVIQVLFKELLVVIPLLDHLLLLLDEKLFSEFHRDGCRGTGLLLAAAVLLLLLLRQPLDKQRPLADVRLVFLLIERVCFVRDRRLL